MTMNLLKKTILFVVLPLIMSCTNCENKLFHFSIPFRYSDSYEVDDADGDFFELTQITESEIQAALDIPEGACIRSVHIRGLTLKATPLEGNETSLMNVGVFAGDNFNQNILVTEDFPVSIVDTTSVLQDLNSLGIQLLRDDIEQLILGLEDRNLTFSISGRSNPAGTRIHANITAGISMTIEYDDCIEIWDFLSDADDCPDPICGEEE